MIIADTSCLLAYFNPADEAHIRVTEAIETSREVFVVSPYVVAELDYLMAQRGGVRREIEALRALSSGFYELVQMDLSMLRSATDVVERYDDQDIGITDASLVVLAERFRTKTILTLDRRHFEVLKPLDGGEFTILP